MCPCVCVSVCVSFRRYTRRRLWSDRDHILHTHADSSPNGSEQNKNQPRVTQGGLGGFRGAKIQKSGITTKRVDQRHQIWYTPADSSGNVHRLNKISPSIPQGAFWGVLGGQKLKNQIITKRVDQLAQNLIHACGFIWEWT